MHAEHALEGSSVGSLPFHRCYREPITLRKSLLSSSMNWNKMETKRKTYGISKQTTFRFAFVVLKKRWTFKLRAATAFAWACAIDLLYSLARSIVFDTHLVIQSKSKQKAQKSVNNAVNFMLNERENENVCVVRMNVCLCFYLFSGACAIQLHVDFSRFSVCPFAQLSEKMNFIQLLLPLLLLQLQLHFISFELTVPQVHELFFLLHPSVISRFSILCAYT